MVVGGVIILSLVILITSVLWLRNMSVAGEYVYYTIKFDEVGTLQINNPVKVLGVTMGKVKAINLKEFSVEVVVELSKQVRLTDSSQVVVQNIGLMGERMIGIKPSPKGKTYKPDNKRHLSEALLVGVYDSGIPEVMGLLGKLIPKVTNIVDTVSDIVYRTVGHKNENFDKHFNSILVQVDSLTTLLHAIADDNDENINSIVNNAHDVSKRLKRVVRTHSSNVDTLVDESKGLIRNLDTLTVDAHDLLGSVDSLVLSVDSLVAGIQEGKGSVGVLLKDNELSTNLLQTIKDLDSLVNNVDDDALKLRIKIFGNKRYFKEPKAEK